jgi:hypothetical protein
MRPWRLRRPSVCTTAAWRSVPARNCILGQRLSLARTNDDFGGFFDSGLLCPNDCAVRLPDPYDSPCQVGSAPCLLYQAIGLIESMRGYCSLCRATTSRIPDGMSHPCPKIRSGSPNPFAQPAVGICPRTSDCLSPPALSCMLRSRPQVTLGTTGLCGALSLPGSVYVLLLTCTGNLSLPSCPGCVLLCRLVCTTNAEPRFLRQCLCGNR